MSLQIDRQKGKLENVYKCKLSDISRQLLGVKMQNITVITQNNSICYKIITLESLQTTFHKRALLKHAT